MASGIDLGGSPDSRPHPVKGNKVSYPGDSHKKVTRTKLTPLSQHSRLEAYLCRPLPMVHNPIHGMGFGSAGKIMFRSSRAWERIVSAALLWQGSLACANGNHRSPFVSEA